MSSAANKATTLDNMPYSVGMPICKKRLGHGPWEIAEMLKCNTRRIFLLLRSFMTKMEMKDSELWAIIACLGDLECEEE